MAIVLDTNIVRPVLAGTQPAASILAPLLEAYNASDGLLVCAPVYAELLAGPGATIAVLDEFLAATGMTIDHTFPFIVWQDAGLAYQAYARRRSAAGQQLPRRILADFIIGAYALRHATALMTLNRDDFMRIFPSLPLIVPNV